MKKTKNTDELFNYILQLQTLDECYDFFEDLCTYKEVEAMANRLEAAKLLVDGKTYEQVIEQVNISSATLSRVSKCVQFGNGYNTVLKKGK